MKNLNLFACFFSLLTIVACKKSEEVGPNDNDNNIVVPGDNDFVYGWAGTEDESHIQNDVFFLGSGNLPDRVDLSEYLPPVGNQGQYGTCVAWALGYNQKTGMNAQDGGYSTADLAQPSNQASPKDLFFSIPVDLKGPNCQGTYLEHAYQMMIDRGVADMGTAPYVSLDDCSNGTQQAWNQSAATNRIESFRQIPVEVGALKEKLAAGHMVGFGANVNGDFGKYRGGVLKTNSGTEGGGHAMLLVGYDDSKQAFKLVNSWSENWGENGFAWVDYGLFVNNFCKYAFVAYNSTNPNPEVNPVNPTASMDLQAEIKSDDDNPNSWNELDRQITFNIHNNSDQTLPASARWDAVYMYFNAYNMDDYGVILHQRITNEFGNGSGQLPNGLGYSYSEWQNVSIPAQDNLANSLFNSPWILWPYLTPQISGEYYLVLIADAFNVIPETDEQNNFYYLTGSDGGPIAFVNGVGTPFSPGSVEDRSSDSSITPRTPKNSQHLNAYTPEELSFFLTTMQKNGKLKEAVDRFKQGKRSIGAGE